MRRTTACRFLGLFVPRRERPLTQLKIVVAAIGDRDGRDRCDVSKSGPRGRDLHFGSNSVMGSVQLPDEKGRLRTPPLLG